MFSRITINNVTFSYPSAADPALSDVSIDIGRGEVVALVGENGSGKTKLAKIVAGLYQPDSGAVFWDQVAIADIDAEQLRNQIAVIAQDHANWQFKDGAELSGGQWQRVAVARGFYRSAPLLIMDEPTAALDARAEHALFASVRNHARERSILIITHRLASVRHADRIYVLRNGRVVEQGSHAGLMALGGQYAELYTLQASQYAATS